MLSSLFANSLSPAAIAFSHLLIEFFTLAVYRIPIKQSIMKGRSYCPKCNHRLEFLDLIPIWSYIFLGGHCNKCKNPIGSIYFLIELLSGTLFALCYKVFGITPDFFLAVIILQIVIFIIPGILYCRFRGSEMCHFHAKFIAQHFGY